VKPPSALLDAAEVARRLCVAERTAYAIMRHRGLGTKWTEVQYYEYAESTKVVPDGWKPYVPKKGAALLYFIQDGNDGPIKIGWTTNVRERISRLQMGNPRPLRVVAVILGGEEEESRWHNDYADQRLRGEWFAPSECLLARIRFSSSCIAQIYSGPTPGEQPTGEGSA
jgi:hypothetical protein